MNTKALGKGLSALIPEKQEKAGTEASVKIKTVNINFNRLQPRTDYDDEKLDELKASIKEKGILQPILVREKDGKYEVIAGERRLRAAKSLGLEEIPVVVKNVSDEDALVLALVENLQREDLNPIEEAEAYQKLIVNFNFTHDTVAQSIGKDRSTVSNFLRLLKLPEEIQKNIFEGAISVGHARALLAVDSIDEKLELAKKVIKNGISVRELENLINSHTKSTKTTKKKKASQDFEILALQEELQRLLGTKVIIQHKKKRGKIIVEYYSLNDFDRIIGKLKK